jgi:hypothetical protein
MPHVAQCHDIFDSEQAIRRTNRHHLGIHDLANVLHISTIREEQCIREGKKVQSLKMTKNALESS